MCSSQRETRLSGIGQLGKNAGSLMKHPLLFGKTSTHLSERVLIRPADLVIANCGQLLTCRVKIPKRKNALLSNLLYSPIMTNLG